MKKFNEAMKKCFFIVKFIAIYIYKTLYIIYIYKYMTYSYVILSSKFDMN